MGLAQSEPLEEQPDFLQLHCTGKPAACGVYSRHGTGTSTVVVSKAKGDLLGVTYNEEGYIRLVEEGSVADKHGLKEHIGKKVLNRDCLDACVDGEKVELCLQDNPWLHNGQHVWSHGTYHLYSTREGKWMLTDSKEGVDKNCGYAMTSAHGGMALTEVPYWMTYVRAKANWEIDASIAVWPYASPLFAVGQLIEYKEKIEDQEFSQGIIGAVRATEGAEQAGAEFKQYVIKKGVSGDGDAVEVFACCVRPLEAYRKDPDELMRSASGSLSQRIAEKTESDGTDPTAKQALIDGNAPIAANVLTQCLEKGKLEKPAEEDDVEKC